MKYPNLSTDQVSEDDSWDSLQQPIHTGSGQNGRFLVLLSALDQGWRVLEPVYLRPRWGEKGAWVFHFLLSRCSGGRIHILTVPAGLEIASLVQIEGWQVDRYPTSSSPIYQQISEEIDETVIKWEPSSLNNQH